jgi:formamidopyrimidine-DNA glycosylase
MPELPEVEIAARHLRAALVDRGPIRMLVPEPGQNGLLDAFAAGTPGALLSVRRHGKQLALDFEDGGTFRLHLGMTGRFEALNRGDEWPRHARFIWAYEGEPRLAFVDPRRFARFGHRRGGHPSDDFAGLGPDALDSTLGEWCLALDRPLPVKPALLEQSRLAGVGNIYACEGLHGAGVDPRRPAHSLSRDTVEILRLAVQRAMRATLEREADAPMRYLNEGGVPNPFRIYGREGEACAACGAAIDRFKQAGRSTWWCPACQGGWTGHPE